MLLRLSINSVNVKCLAFGTTNSKFCIVSMSVLNDNISDAILDPFMN
jgi:hypothetical protein